MTQLEKIEKILEYNHMSQNYMFLAQTFNKNVASLKKTPGNIVLMGDNEKIRKDIDVLLPIMAQVQKEILEDFQEQHDCKFSFLIKPDETKINGAKMGVNKKEE